MNDAQLQRYARHVMLEGIGIEGQHRLLAAHALVIGAGGLGGPAAMFLGTAGVGRVTIVDHDAVDATNLQRQIAHELTRLGQPKADSVAMTIARRNPDPRVQAVRRRADAALLDELVPGADVVLDCSDNFATRHAVNAACVRHGRPLVSGAALGWDAQFAVFDPRAEDSPCYACLYPPDAAHEEVACSTMGVLAPLVGVIGSLQAAEALKLLLADAPPAHGQLLLFDARHLRWDRLAVPRRAGCPVCGTR